MLSFDTIFSKTNLTPQSGKVMLSTPRPVSRISSI